MESDGVLKVSSRPKHSRYIYEGKEALKKNPEVAFHAIGESVSNAVRAADSLIALGYATLERFETLSLDEKDFEGRPKRVYKVIIKLSRTSNFDALYQEFEKTKAEKPTSK
ncbi:unnamed protein product [Blepharisma stoltei]|uniref:DNA/RNA-binding protein Alba-like domain-containing protein n=1 Tax=Blepharisma stoltei TaxID=1481888 RepID=A0AAU9I9B8_9CILI|nr:unnamed protein product [Blepharisma stoltei]